MAPDVDYALLDHLPDAIIGTGIDGAVLYWSKGAETLFGYARHEAIGRRLDALIVPPDRLDEEHRLLRETLAAGHHTYEAVRQKRDGSLIHVEVSGRAVRDPRTDTEFVLFTKRDITELKVTRAAALVEARFGTVLDSMPDAIVMVNRSGRIVHANRQTEALFGYDPGALTGEPVERLLPEALRAAHVGHRAQYFSRPRVRTMGAGLALHGRRADGTEFPVEISLSPIETEEGTFALSAIRDVTERKRFEHAVQETNAIASHAAGLEAEVDMRRAVERRLNVQYAVARALAETVSIEDGTREVLRVICESLGFANGAIWEVDRDADVLRCLEVWCAEPERQAEYAARLRRSTITRDSGLPGRVWASNQAIWVPDITVVTGLPNAAAAARAGLLAAIVLPVTSGGDVIGVMRLGANALPPSDAALTDLFAALSHQLGQYIERRRQQQSFRYLFHHNPAPMWVFARDSLRFLEVNDAAIRTHGFSRDEFLTMRLTDIRLPEDGPLVITGLDTAAGEYHDTPGQRHRRKDGGIIDVDIFAHNFTYQGWPARLVLALDVTARKAAEAQLRQALKMESIGQLTGGMAHDFNNLLLVIMGNLELLREMRGDDPEIEELAGEAHEAASRGADLIRSLLAFARRQPLQPKRSNLNALVSGIASLLERTLGEQIEVALDLAATPWPVSVDPVQLETALVNLATNARDAMPKGGRLTIATSNQYLDADYAARHSEVKPGDYAVLAVSDSGTGIPIELQTRIFDPFVTTKEEGKGTGLGLSMVFGFMRQSGGHINLYSEIGVGTTFRLYLPRDRTAVETYEPAATEPAPTGHGETVLVVEDNVALRRLVLRQLSQLGYRAVEAETASAALALLEDGEAIDMLFTDLVMAGALTGVELARTVTVRWPGVRVLLTSGFPDAKADRGGELPVTARLLSKPYLKEDLARVVREVLDHGATQAASTQPRT